MISLGLLLLLFSSARADDSLQWVNHGNGILNQRKAIGPGYKITAETVTSLRPKWKFSTGFAVTVTPSIADGAIYFTGSNGLLYALEEETGYVRWCQNLTTLLGEQIPTLGRATPVVVQGSPLLLVGLSYPPIILAVNRCAGGSLVWRSPPLDFANLSIITMSGTVFEGYYYVGVSSAQEGLSEDFSFIGSFQKLSLRDGSVVWRTPMLPYGSGYYGAAIWGSSPSIDVARQLVFIATGNNHQVPEYVETCESNRTTNSTQNDPDPCLSPCDHHDSMLALSMDDGAIKWSTNLLAYDVWTIPCQSSPNTPNCPAILGPDYDFGEAPLLLYLDALSNASNPRCLIIAGQKSGVVWALDCDNGTIIWATVAGPGGILGGASWGLSTDKERVYTNIINDEGRDFVLVPENTITRGGGWVAMDSKTGTILWSTPDPSLGLTPGPTSASQGVVFGTSFSNPGFVYGLDSLTGSILWSSPTGSGIYGGVSIGSSCIFVGNGYNRFPFPNNPNGTFVTAFCLLENDA